MDDDECAVIRDEGRDPSDPAVMSAPFIATLVDATGLIIYFEIARRVIGLHF